MMKKTRAQEEPQSELRAVLTRRAKMSESGKIHVYIYIYIHTYIIDDHGNVHFEFGMKKSLVKLNPQFP